jgi:hypothetical protein
MLWTFIILILASFTLALGIRPAKTNMISDQTRSLESQFWVVNDEKDELSFKIYVEGEMAQYVTLAVSELSFREDDEALPVSFKVQLPEQVLPGTSTANIIIEEDFVSGSGISSKVVIKHKVNIEGPYPDKYIQAKLNFQEQTDQIVFVSEVENLGKQDLNNVKTTFYVNDKKQDQHELQTEETSLKTKENKLLKSTVSKDLFELGEFEVSAVTQYDDQKVEVIKSLRLGEPKIDITYFTPFFVAKKINQYSLDLKNLWNKEINNVYVDIEVQKDGQRVDQFRTKSVALEAESLKRVNDYFDARSREEGKYLFEMIVNYWDVNRMEKKPFQVEILPEEDYKESLTSAAVSSSSASSFTSSTLPWLIALLLFGLICGYVGWRYAHREQYEGGSKGIL